MKVVFMGTPEFAVLPLKSILDAGHQVVACVSQVDKVNSRGNKVIFNPIKKFALENNLPILQFEKIRIDGIDELKKLDADIIVTCAYGQLLSKEILELYKYGVINIHSSLLPKHRGASPISSSLLSGDKVTGVTIMQTNIGMDEGDMLLKGETEILEEDNSISLSEKLSKIGAECVCKVLSDIDFYLNNREKQDDNSATKCGKITKEMTRLNFNKNATTLVREIKAFALNPTSYFECDGKRYKVFNAKNVENVENKECGIVLKCNKQDGLIISCLGGGISITEIQAPNGKKLKIKDFLNGNSFKENSRCE